MTTTMTRSSRSWLPVLGWIAVLSVGLWFFHGLGSGWLEPPPLEPSGWQAWARGRDPLVATVAVLRLVVLALGWYLAVATLVGIAVRIARVPHAVWFADRLTLPALRRFLGRTLGVSLVAAMVATGPTTAGVGPAAHASPDAPVAVQVDGGGRSAARPLPLDLASGDEAFEVLPNREVTDPSVIVLREVDGFDDASAVGAGAAGIAAANPVLGDAHGQSSEGDQPLSRESVTETAADLAGALFSHEQTVLVQPGDSLWSMARDALAGAIDDRPTDAQIVPYWTQVIERNRDGLADPSNPDLIFPGDVIVLPPLDTTRSLP